MTATSRRGSVSAIAIAARRPAAPPPTSSTSWSATTSPSLTPELLVDEHLVAVVHHHPVHAAVVELLPCGTTSAVEEQLFGDEALLVLGHEALALTALPAGRGRGGESAGRRGHLGAPPS